MGQTREIGEGGVPPDVSRETLDGRGAVAPDVSRETLRADAPEGLEA